MERFRPIISVADDGNLHPAINRGIELAAAVGLTHADYMVETNGLKHAVTELKARHPEVGVGLHIDASSEKLADYGFIAMAYWDRWRAGPSVQKLLSRVTEMQLKRFQDLLGVQPTHVSVHGHLNFDHHGEVFVWFVDLMQRLLGEDYGGVLIRGIHTQSVRYMRAREAILGKRPLRPREFEELVVRLSRTDDKRLLEVLVHPATKAIPGEPKLYSFYSLPLRQRDLEAFKAIALGVSVAASFPQELGQAST